MKLMVLNIPTMPNIKPQKSESAAAPTSHTGASSPLSRLVNLGPKSAQFLIKARIETFEQLQSIGSVMAYAMVKRVEPDASLNLLWAIEGAITGIHWREIAKDQRTSLLRALDRLERESARSY